MLKSIDSFFKISENKSDMRTEVMAGITTFMTMAYIIFVNPSLLANAGMPFDSLMVSTCLAAAFATVIMALLANYPVALASGMGLNAFFAFTVVGVMNIPWQQALAAVFVEGLIFVVLTFTGIREGIVNSIPISMKHGISAGIGMFIAFIGFQGAGLTIDNAATLVSAAHLYENAPALLSLLGVIIIAALEARKIRGAILWGILIITVISIPLGVTKMPEAIVSMPPSISPIFMQLDFSGFGTDLADPSVINFWIVVLTFFFVDFFDTIGTLVGVVSRGNMLDKNGHLPRAKQALLADAIGTSAGAVLGVSTVTSYVESTSGVGVGGRTGFASIVTALLFLLAIFFNPVISIVPPCATASALIFVGVYMMIGFVNINKDDWTELVPAMMPVFAMPFTYSIASGIELAILTYPILKLFTGKVREVPIFIWIMAAIFVFKEIFI